jgi:Tfp pilus assembly protein PilF
MRAGLKPLLRGSGGFGELMAATVPIFAALALRVRRPRRALLCGATSALAWLATLQSLERAPFVGAVAGLLLLFTGVLFKAGLLPRRRARAALLGGTLMLLLAAQAVPLSFGGRGAAGAGGAGAADTISRLRGGLSGDANTHARLLFWGVGLEMLRAHPVLGVGGNNYEVAYAEARARFSARHPASPLVGMNEDLLTVYAHNEYVQMLAELGVVGLLLFVLMSCLLVAAFLRALKQASQALAALGCAGGMLAFAVSSGASASSFRYFGGGLVFFFAAAVITNAARRAAGADTRPSAALTRVLCARRGAAAGGLALALALTLGFNIQAASVVLCGMAEASADASRAESLYRASLRLQGGSAGAHFSYGAWLFNRGREREAVAHLRFAVERGFNASTCYAYLAGAEANAGDEAAAERTLAEAVRVFPRSVFLRARHASALARVGRAGEAELEMAAAVLIDSRAARGWRKLIDDDIDAASDASRRDPQTYATPGELQPDEAVFAVLKENEKRFPEAARKGGRGHARAN